MFLSAAKSLRPMNCLSCCGCSCIYWAIPDDLFFFIFVFTIQLTAYKYMLMTGFEPLVAGIGSTRSTN